MIWLLIGLAIAFVVVVFCACRVSGQQDAAAEELEWELRYGEDGRGSEG